MIQLTVEKAQAQLPEVLARVKLGEAIEIHPESGELYLLVTMAKHDNGAAAWPGYPKAGSLKGKIWMSEDFDEPVEELLEYME